MTDYSKIDRPEFLELIFFPKQEEKSPLPGGAIDIDVPVEDDVTIGCRFYGVAKDAPNIIYFHGNGETVNDHNEIAFMYNKHGINLFVTSYRGYGWSTGSPSIGALMRDSKKLFSYAQNWLSDNEFSGQLFVMGRSLGCASAIELTTDQELPIKGLLIESGFADSLPLAERLGVDVSSLGVTEEDGFNNRQKIMTIDTATFILHGQNDTLIPIAEAEKLQAFCAARNKQFQIIPGAEHNTMISVAGDMYFEAIKKFIDTLLGVNTWRRKRKASKEN